MTISPPMIWLIIGCALVTIVPRILPFIVVQRIQLPKIVVRWLSFIPVCIFTALIVQGLLLESEDTVMIDWHMLFALIPTVFIAIKTKSLSLTVIGGVAVMALIRFIS